MRFLHDHPQTRRLLESWAHDSTLHMAGFFFYHQGCEEQKSQDGLFRGILHDLLQDQPELIAEVLPEMWREASISDKKLTLPTKLEMMSALRRLVQTRNPNHKYCIFIDGLDEFSGRPDELVKVIQHVVAFPNVKLVVSSRPINSCNDAFSGRPSLQLEDLTRNDMVKYIDNTLGSSKNIHSIRKRDPHLYTQLRADLVAKATGVFLWLVLVCQDLSTALSDGENWQAVQQRADQLPSGLEPLFQHMFEKISPSNRQWAFRILRMCLADFGGPGVALQISTLGLALADSHDLDISKLAGLNPRDETEDFEKCRKFQARIRARCCGLVETFVGYWIYTPTLDYYGSDDSIRGEQVDASGANTMNPYDESKVSLLCSSLRLVHRTLSDFMIRDDFTAIRSQMGPLDCDFDTGLAIALTKVHTLFAFGNNPPRPGDEEGLYYLMKNLFYEVDEDDEQTSGQLVFLLDELLLFARNRADENCDNWEATRQPFETYAPFTLQRLALAAELRHRGLFGSLWRGMGRPHLATVAPHCPILQGAISHSSIRTLSDYDWWTFPHADFLHYLLDCGCDPNARPDGAGQGEGETASHLIMRTYSVLADLCSSKEEQLEEFAHALQLLRLCIEHGANLADVQEAVDSTPYLSGEAYDMWEDFARTFQQCETEISSKDGTVSRESAAASRLTSNLSSQPHTEASPDSGSTWDKKRPYSPPTGERARKRTRVEILSLLNPA